MPFKLVSSKASQNDDSGMAAGGKAGAVIEPSPDPVAARISRARDLYLGGQTEAALAECRQALEIDTACAAGYSLMGSILLDRAEPVAAREAFERALSIAPDNPNYQFNLGNALRTLGDLDGALDCFGKVIALDRSDYEAHNNRGNILMLLGRTDDAARAYETAVEINPDYVPAIVNLSMHYEASNQLEKASELLARALALDPEDQATTLHAAVLDRRLERWEDALKKLACISEERLPTEKLRAEYRFEAGRVHDRLQHEDEAVSHFARANQLALAAIAHSNPDLAVYRDRVAAMTQIYEPAWLGQWQPMSRELPGRAPVFLIGFPRSGTTLLDQILSSHPDIHVLEELPLIAETQSRFGIDQNNHRSRIPSLDTREILKIRSAYLDAIAAQAGGVPDGAVVDKLPLNTVELGFIHRAFPDAKIIFALRHPCDVVFSCFMQNFELNEAMIQFGSLENSAHIYDRIMSLYRQYRELLDLDLITVRYEDVVSDLEREIRRLIEFLGLPWDDAVLDYRKTARAKGRINTPSYSAVTEEIYRHARYRWHRYRDHLQPVLPLLEPWSHYFGYE